MRNQFLQTGEITFSTLEKEMRNQFLQTGEITFSRLEKSLSPDWRNHFLETGGITFSNWRNHFLQTGGITFSRPEESLSPAKVILVMNVVIISGPGDSCHLLPRSTLWSHSLNNMMSVTSSKRC
jgi:hypothetical protein